MWILSIVTILFTMPFGGALLYNIGSVRFENDSYQVFDFQNIL